MAKRKENGLGSIRKRKDGTWEGRFSAGGQRFSVYGKTSTEVRRRLTEAQRQIDISSFVMPDKITVGEWLQRWQADYLPDVKPSTRSCYEYFSRCYIVPSLGQVRLQKLTGPMIQHFFSEAQKPLKIRLEDGTEFNSRGLSPSSLKSLRNVLSRCLSQAEKCGLIFKNPCSAVVLPTIEKKEMRTIEDVGKFLEIVSGDRFENIFVTALFTGLRQSEIIGLTWDRIDFETGIITVDRQYRRDHSKGSKEYQFTSTKNGKARFISPAQFVLDALKSERKKQMQNRLRYGSAFENKNGFVFTDEIGRPLKYSTINDRLKSLLKANGIDEDIHFHSLRHSFATLSIQNGDDIKTVSETLGHSTAAFTMDQYAHVTQAMRKRSGERMQSLIESIKKGVG